MSNWASVILTWSGVDDAVHGDDAVDTRLRTISDAYAKECDRSLAPFVVSYSCGPKSTGSTCEVVAVCQVNHFCSDACLRIIGDLAWEMPEEVQVMFKREEDEHYQVWGLRLAHPEDN